MSDQLPAGRPVTNFLWRYTPRFGERTIRVLKWASFGFGLVALCLYAAEIFRWAQKDISRLDYTSRSPSTWLILSIVLRVGATFSSRRNFVNPLLAQGTDLATANSAWEAQEQAKPLFERVCG
jgi:hypothetical protein